VFARGTVVRHKPTKQKVTYICACGVEDLHIVVAPKLGFEDDGVREVRGKTLVPIIEAPAFSFWKKTWKVNNGIE